MSSMWGLMAMAMAFSKNSWEKGAMMLPGVGGAGCVVRVRGVNNGGDGVTSASVISSLVSGSAVGISCTSCVSCVSGMRRIAGGCLSSHVAAKCDSCSTVKAGSKTFTICFSFPLEVEVGYGQGWGSRDLDSRGWLSLLWVLVYLKHPGP